MNFKEFMSRRKILIPAIVTIYLTLFAVTAFAAITTPYTVSYSGRLTDSGGNPVTTAQNIRFSLWSDSDVDATDFLVGGAIDPAAGGYSGWNEVHTVTPDSNGLFHVRLGSITTLPNFTSSVHVYLQVDVKPNGTPDTSYETLDPDGNTANLDDRHPINSSAFAINSDTVDNRDVGLSAGEIPYLDGSALLPISTIPGGTNADNFIIDVDDSVTAPGSIALQFGSTLAKVLEYDLAASYFNFNDDVNITGDLSVTGDTVLLGDLSAPGNVDFSSSTEFHIREVADEAAATCTTINELVLDTNENIIYVCTAPGAPGTWIAAAGGLGGAYPQSLVYEPEYNDSVMSMDGTDNRGKLEIEYADTDGTPGNANINYYVWTTRQAGMQDIDLIIRTDLPDGFTGWQITPIELTFRTEDDVLANNRIDVSVEDVAGTPVSLTGATGLFSSTASTTGITFIGAPTWTPGEPITIKIKLSATSVGAAYVGKLSLNYTGL